MLLSLSTTKALNSGHAWGGTLGWRFCLLCNQPRRRNDLGQITSLALVSPGAPSVVSVTGVLAAHA